LYDSGINQTCEPAWIREELMPSSYTAEVLNAYLNTNTRILNFVEKLSDEQLHWATTQGQSIAFHLWHVARWTDHLQAALPGMTPELTHRLAPGAQFWQTHAVGQRWGFASGLGYDETGMGMGDDVSARLPFPAKEIMLDYARNVFAAVERSVQAIDDEQFQAREQPQPATEGIWEDSTVGDAILTHLTHTNRHLGMMECLLGLQGGSGSATV
jgi:uncharacterized damage-inducible protein DinB